ncbi:hypothetical protein THRCLA_20812 [Thraustotheca clavata]|uniref:Uncharacterized protein n=1 Tax=Thraustotheca clavata TaxID=74557 RepID=A0A1W0A377_9STRA|nr:hypothetical protein THRCLA_20812 [Thraustotheca clavata]
MTYEPVETKSLSDDTSTASSCPSSPSSRILVNTPRPIEPIFTFHAPPPKAMPKSIKTCLYRTGKCNMPRHIKPNGSLHKLCTFHRSKANENQRRLDQKKKDAGFHRRERISPYKIKGVLQPKFKLQRPPKPVEDYMPDIMIPFLLDNYNDVILEEVMMV